jgi:tetratricopeptide (TPR) repeat protein
MPSRMPHRVSLWRRSPREWAGHVALTCGIAVLAYYSIVFSVAQVAVRSQPEKADEGVSYDGRLSAAHAATLITPTSTPVERARAEALSQAALRRDPTAVSAAATLGVAILARGDTADARRLLTYAQKLSRRNIQTQLWSIEDAVDRGDVPSALHWYDIALRTKPELSEILYPVLARASHDPAIRAALVNTLSEKPLWANGYVSYAAAQRDDPQSTAQLFVRLRARGVTIPASAQAALVNVLFEAGNIEQAWRYYTVIHRNADRTRSRDPRFTAMLDTPSVFDWSPLADNSIAASIQQSRDGGAFEFSAPASIGGAVLQQIQLLPAGTYRLSGHSDGIAQDSRALPYWTLTCRRDGRELGRIAIPNSSQSGGMFAGTLTVLASCPVQTLTMFAQPSDAIGGTSGQIDRLMLAPAGPGAR